jgi:hypothetical protein
MTRKLLYLSALLLILVPAAVSYKTSRATDSFDERAVTDHLGKIPMQFGDWVADTPDEEDVSAFKDEKYPGIIRRYVNRALGRQVLLLIRGGSSGPLVYHHQPQQCYIAIGFSPQGRTISRRIGLDEFAAADFSKQTAGTASLRLYWAWSGDGAWAAPEEPRFRFTSYPLLFRLYVVEATGSPSDAHDGDACEEFLRTALPEINRTLFIK